MSIRKARNGDVEIAYEVHGPPEGAPLLLVSAGAGTQMVMWPAELITALVAAGFQVATMDQRDDGLSTHLTQFDHVRRRRGELAYTLRDLSDDAVAVLDALGWSSAVVAGASLGGVFAQALACHHPDRVSGLISMLSMPGSSFRLTRPKIRTVLRMLRVMHGTSPNRDAEGQKWVDVFRVFGSKQDPPDDDHWRQAGQLAFDRGRNPHGELRHVAAVFAAGDRRGELARLRITVLVVHGRRDPLVSWRAGKATADAIPGARFVLYPGVGHHLPRRIWPALVAEISALFARSDTSAVR